MTNSTTAAAGTGLSFIGLALSVNQFQAIFALITTIFGLILMAWNLFDKVKAKYKKAKKDGHISKEEAEDIADTIKDGLEDIVDEVNKAKEESKKIRK